jgi:hypothetical protein
MEARTSGEDQLNALPKTADEITLLIEDAIRAALDSYLPSEQTLERLRRALKLSECDCCVQMKAGCINTTTGGSFPMDVRACPQCRGADEDDEPRVTYRERELAALIDAIKSARRARRFDDARWYIGRVRLLRASSCPE